MKSNSLFRVCLIFYTYDSANFKKNGITPWKNVTRYCAGPCLLQDVPLTDFSTVQNKPAAVAPKETITHHFFVSGIGQKKLSMQPKFVAAAENVVKTETQQTFVNGLLGFITLGIYTRWKRVCIIYTLHELPIDMGNSICTAH